MARTRGKSDPIDALAVAHAVLQNPDLPVAAHDEVSRELKLLTDRREDLVGQRTPTINRFLDRVHELDPAQNPKKGSMDRIKTHNALAVWLDTQHGVLAEVAREELADTIRLTAAITALAARIGERVQKVAPTLLALPGCGELTAAKILAETAGISRFRSSLLVGQFVAVVELAGAVGHADLSGGDAVQRGVELAVTRAVQTDLSGAVA